MLLFSYLPQYNSNLYLTLSHRFKKASLLTKKELNLDTKNQLHICTPAISTIS